MNFTSPMKLEDFAKSNQVKDLAKLAWPYEKWSNMKDIMRCTKFPPYNDFQSSLSRPQDEKFITELVEVCNELTKSTFIESEMWGIVTKFFQLEKLHMTDYLIIENAEFKSSKSENFSQPLHTSPLKYYGSRKYFDQNCLTMLDLLKEYNYLDVRLLSKSIQNYSEGFWRDFQVNVHQFMSLPAVAETIAYKNYDKKSDPVYTFSNDFKWLNDEVRSSLNGGMCLVLHRLVHVTEGPKIYPDAAYQAKNGEDFQKLLFLDFNSLYPFAVKNELPTGPGLFLRRKNNSNFKIHGMLKTGKKASIESLEWLEFLNSTKKYQGKIQHAYNKGEKKVAGYFVDGYLTVRYRENGEEVPEDEEPDEELESYTYAFDYNGCIWHDCPHKCMPSRQSKSEIDKEKDRAKAIMEAVDEYVVMTSCRWQKIKQRRPFESIDYPFIGSKFIRERDVIQGRIKIILFIRII